MESITLNNGYVINGNVCYDTLRPSECEYLKAELEKEGFTVTYTYRTGIYFQRIYVINPNRSDYQKLNSIVDKVYKI